jgi:hypothetical protein
MSAFKPQYANGDVEGEHLYIAFEIWGIFHILVRKHKNSSQYRAMEGLRDMVLSCDGRRRFGGTWGGHSEHTDAVSG